jgi:hypothetical protein
MHCTVIKKIQFLACFLLIVVPGIGEAGSGVTLQWEPHVGNIEGYQIFGRKKGQEYDYDSFWWQGDHTYHRCTIEGLDENTTYFFVVRSFSGDDISYDSTEVSAKPSDISENSSDGGSGCFMQSLFR